MPSKIIAVLALLAVASGTFAATHYVDLHNPNPTPPYTNWATAANVIQDAVDLAAAGDEVAVTNGVYATGGRPVGTNVLANRVAVEKSLSVRSVNGPEFNSIQGHLATNSNRDGSVRCVYLTNGGSLAGFTLMNGATLYVYDPPIFAASQGGDVWCPSPAAVVSNCVIVSNSAYSGGGASGGTMLNCTLGTNSALSDGGCVGGCSLDGCTLSGSSADSGGAAWGSTLRNCTLSGNSASWGGGADSSYLTNCTLSGNYGDSGGGADQSVLDNCALFTNVAGLGGGGGASGCVLKHCTLKENLSYSYGGGAAPLLIDQFSSIPSTLEDCTLEGNSAEYCGGGAASSTLISCTLAGNSVDGPGGGAWDSILKNCVIYFNTAAGGANYDTNCLLSHCCTAPMPTSGFGNITNAPLFTDLPGGNLRLQSNSPCINAGNSAYAPDGPDLDGNLRISGGTVDIGAYEFQKPASIISYAWLQQYGLPTHGSVDFFDPDGDGMNNWQEWRCGTDPANALSVLRLLPPVRTGTNVIVSWQSVAGVNYFLERSTNLAMPVNFMSIATNLPGRAGTTIYPDANAIGRGPFFYRVRVGN